MLTKAALAGLKPQECECRSGRNKSQTPYIAKKNKLDMSQVSTHPISRHKPIIWSLSRTLEGDMSQGCSLGPPASGGPINRHNRSIKDLNIHLILNKR